MADLFVVVDGNSLVHRAFHALPYMTSPAGHLTNATYGFTNMLLRALGDLRPTHVAAAFDTPRPTFRHKRYADYKGTRSATPDGLPHQFAQVLAVLEVLGIPSFRAEGWEADDILGTLAVRAAERGLDVIVVSGDTDALQLVTPKIRVLAPRRGLTDTVLYDEAAVRERYGLDPAQLVDLRALRGDVSDNIPGVPGVGDKTATKLLETYHDLEGILANLDRMPARQREQLQPYTDQMHLSLDLARIVLDAPVELDLEQCALHPPERDKLLPLFHELGFRSLIDRALAPEGPTSGRPSQPKAPPAGSQPSLFDAPPVPVSMESPEVSVQVARTVAEVVESVEKLKGTGEPVGIVLVLNQPDPMRAEVVGIGLGSSSADCFYVPLSGEPSDGAHPLDRAEALEALRPLLADPGVAKTSAHTKQAMIALARAGVELRGVDLDSALAAYLVEPSQRTLTLQDLAWSRFNRELPAMKSVTGEGRSALAVDAVPIGKMAGQVCAETATLSELRPILQRELVEGGFEELYSEVELPLVSVLAAMEIAGITVDVPYLKELSRELYERINGLEANIYQAVGHEFNINSPPQLGVVLFDELKLPGAKRTATGKASTAADVLTGLRGAHPCVDFILEHRELTKLKSTYVDALPLLVHPETGRIHTTFNQTVAATGRLSSVEPNVQNIPVRTELGRRVRRAFVAPDPGWKLLSADYSQIELRIQAHLTQDPTLMEAFQAGDDVHRATAAELFSVPIEEVTADQRRLAKTANFAIIYGISAFGFAEQTGMTQQESAQFIKSYFERFHGVDQFQKRLIKEARETGYVQTLLGRKRIIPELRASIHAVRAAGERMAINAPVQGTASDIIKIAMVRLHDYLAHGALRTRMLLQVHDELMFEVPDDEVDLLKTAAKEIMEGSMTLSVPLVVDVRVAENWGAMY